jgi:Fe-S cluster assembly protein SufB
MPAVAETLQTVESVTGSGYKWGFSTDIEMDIAPKGLTEDTIRLISARKEEPEWLLAWRLKAFAAWQTMAEPNWAKVEHPPIDYQDLHYYAAPKKKTGPKSLDEVDPELLAMYEKLGIPLKERAILAGVEGAGDIDEGERRPDIAVDAVFDSVSVATTFRVKLAEAGVIFCPISEAVREHPELVRQYLGSVVPAGDNFFAALNSAVFTDGSFVFIPKGVRCPMELSTYFRINARNTGQFERTLIIAEAGSYVSYLEGCTAPQRDENQLHAAVVELVAFDDAQIKYSTVQNWYPGDAEGRGGIYNFVTKRGACRGARSKISWTQVETGSAITWKYPSCILQGDDSVGEFYSVAVTTNRQQADTGTKMIHIGRNTKSTIVSKGISAGRSNNTYRGQVKVMPKASGARNYTQCDSLLIGDQCGAHTVPYIESRNPTATLEHEATTSKIAEDQLFYCRQRGLSEEDAVNLIVNGFCKDVLKELPMEFAVEAQKLLAVSLEGSVG